MSALGDFFGGVANGLSSLLDPIFGFASVGLEASALKQSAQAQKDANRIAEQNLAYQKEFNQKVFDRQDTSYQRAVSDAVQAGFSPLVASGTAGGTAGGVVSAPQRQSTADIAMSSANLKMGIASNLLALSRQRAEIANIEAQTQKTQAETGNIDFTQKLQSAQFDFLTEQEKNKLTMFYDGLSAETKRHLDNLGATYRGQDLQRDLQDFAQKHEKELVKMNFENTKMLKELDYMYDGMVKALEFEYQNAYRNLEYGARLQFEKDLHKFKSENMTPQEKWALINGSVFAGSSTLQAVSSFIPGLDQAINLVEKSKKSPIGFGH